MYTLRNGMTQFFECRSIWANIGYETWHAEFTTIFDDKLCIIMPPFGNDFAIDRLAQYTYAPLKNCFSKFQFC